MSIQSSVIIIIIIISVMLHVCCSRLQQQVEFFPINNWNCSSDSEKICAIDTPSETLKTSSLTECTMHCWMKLPGCLQFNYYSTHLTVTSSNCAIYNFHPKNYVISTDCQHYVVKHFLYSFRTGVTEYKPRLR